MHRFRVQRVELVAEVSEEVMLLLGEHVRDVEDDGEGPEIYDGPRYRPAPLEPEREISMGATQAQDLVRRFQARSGRREPVPDSGRVESYERHADAGQLRDAQELLGHNHGQVRLPRRLAGEDRPRARDVLLRRELNVDVSQPQRD